MKKIKLLILSIFTVVSTVYSQNAQPEYFRNAWQFGKLKGKVKSYTESNFDVDGMLLRRMTNNFDNTGNLIEEYFYNKNDILQSREIYIYDTSDKIIERKKFNADGKLLHRKTGKFDNKGHIVEFRNSNSNAANILEIQFTCVNTYNDSDKIIEQTRYNSDGRKRSHSLTNTTSTIMNLKVANTMLKEFVRVKISIYIKISPLNLHISTITVN